MLAEFGGRVELSAELTGFEQNAETVTATLSRGGRSEKVVAHYLVGADGGRSFVRGALGVGFEGETWASERMLVGDVRVDGLDREHWHSWPSTELGWVALCPLPATDSFQFQAQIGPEEPDEPSLDRFQQIIDERTGGVGIRLKDASWLSLYRANVRMVDRYRVGRVFLAGDAAHVHSPAGGQGMNTGIQDAYNLGWKLGQVLNGAPAELLDTYEEERLPVAAWMLGVTSKLHRDSLQGTVRDYRHRLGPETLQLGINYRNSSLTREPRESPGSVRAGDRAPDAPCHTAAGAPLRLFDVFRGPHFTLLGFEPLAITQHFGSSVRTCLTLRAGEAAEARAIIDTVMVDTEGHARRAYDVQDGTLVLIRPDGYIGLITERGSEGSIREYLKPLIPAESEPETHRRNISR
jgi:hypothetical protein